MRNCAIILSGSGVYDGSEIHETTLTYYFLEKNNINVSFFAPNCNQMDVINHLDGSTQLDTRNVLIESARIARGQIDDLNTFDTDNVDMVIFPGGFGAAKTLSTYAKDGTNLTVLPQIETIIKSLHQQQIPIGFLCITPIIAAKVIPNIITTLGINQPQLDQLETLGAQYRQALEHDVISDNTNLIYSTPAYMIDTSISKIAIGIEKLIKIMHQKVIDQKKEENNN